MDKQVVYSSIEKLCKFLDKGVTPYHVVINTQEILENAGFKNLDYKAKWNIEDNLKGFIKVNDSSIFAFNLNKETLMNEGFKFISSHIDSPCLKIKNGSDVIYSDGSLYLNVEVYGGPILNTWLDRGLSIAGRVFLKSKDYEETYKIDKKFIDFKEPILFIPNCPIHLNRDVNLGFNLNKQKHMLPLICNTTISNVSSLRELIAKTYSINIDDILDFDLYIYESQKAECIGIEREFIQSKKIDDLAMAQASIESLINTPSNKNKFICLFDGEEIGSSIIEGAFSHTLLNIMDRIYEGLGFNFEEKNISISNSFMISADMAHAYNPSYSEKFDENNKCILNKGVVIKSNANRSYMTTGETSAYFISLCEKVNVEYQFYFNRSDMVGGSTLGPLTSRYVSINGIDIGNPMYAMHSCRETAGVYDHYNLIKVFEEYFS